MSALMPVTVCVLPSALLTGGFVLIPLLDCKLPEGRNWVLLILSPFGYHLPVFLWGITPFPTGFDFGGMVKVSYQADALSLEFEFWVMGFMDWQWLALTHPGQGARRSHSLVPASQIPGAALVPELSAAWSSDFPSHLWAISYPYNQCPFVSLSLPLSFSLFLI